jgi:hypothetical protein
MWQFPRFVSIRVHWWFSHSLLFAVLLIVPSVSPAITITSSPSFTPAGSAAPLAGILQITTDVPSRITVSVDDGTNTWERSFLDYTNIHSMPIFGFKPGRTNEITVTAWDKYRNSVTGPAPLIFVTAPLPSNFPKIVVLQSNTNRMEPGYTLFRGLNFGFPAYVIIVDQLGDVVWYGTPSTRNDVRQLPNGDLFIPIPLAFNEVNLLGQTNYTWNVASSRKVNGHDGVPTPHGTILYLSDTNRTITNFPTSAFNSNAPTATTNILYQLVMEISQTNSGLLNTWNTLDMLDPRRISYLTFSSVNGGVDWGHANAVIEDPRDDSLIVSLRHQNAVIKFSRATSQLKWILGPHENWGPSFQPYLLTPVGTPFKWNYAQHAPKLTPQGTILLYDDGDYRASPFDAWIADANNYSRAVEFSIDETNMTVSQVWEYDSSDQTLYTGALGDADYLPNQDNILVTYGLVSYVNGVHPSSNSPSATMVRIKEVTHDPVPEVVWDLALWDYSNTNSSYAGTFCYRSDRIPDLYSALPQPVTDLAVTVTNGAAHVMFSRTLVQTYFIQASTNLVDWDTLGQAEASGNGNYDYDDPQDVDFPARFYRVVTQ